jgi:mannose-6-phosphate isomerase-like protein (cupin superfamily)
MHQNRRSVRPALGGVAVALGMTVVACSAQPSARDRHPERPVTADHPSAPFRLSTAQWSEPYNGPLGYPKGAQRASLGTDPRSGGETYYARFPAGSHFELHWHSHAEYAVVLRGRVTHTLARDSIPLEPGDYVIVAARVPHGWTVDVGGDAYLLIRRDGPADFNFVER